ncbi:MAG TPA: hypothetical protein VFY06_02180 [Verrucomicrobiae bacterium]|nr:hypothetical protein [Verrucomicrobiae bacterium]
MKSFPSLVLLICLAITQIASGAESTVDTNVLTFDYSAIRGANYTAATGHHLEHWLHYDPKVTDRDLGYAKRINVNQIRVFLSYSAYLTNREVFLTNLVLLTRACQAHGIGLMPVVTYKSEMIHESAPYPLSRAWARDLLDAIGHEPALAFWDVFNEPDYPPTSTNFAARIAYARVMAQMFRELDTRRPRTPVTIGFTYETNMEKNADVVDVLSYHDYSPTREEVQSNITAAFTFSAKVHKPVINTETACTCRANPYDMVIQEFSDAHMGFYIWELMITEYWGNVHGVFYPDGTVRDPSIPAAMLGFYRNRGTNVVLEFPDREGWVTRTVTNSVAWLNDPNASYARGLDLAETAANLLEANELVAMRDLPSRHVLLLREESPDPARLRELLADFVKKLEPYERKNAAR